MFKRCYLFLQTNAEKKPKATSVYEYEVGDLLSVWDFPELLSFWDKIVWGDFTDIHPYKFINIQTTREAEVCESLMTGLLILVKLVTWCRERIIAIKLVGELICESGY